MPSRSARAGRASLRSGLARWRQQCLRGIVAAGGGGGGTNSGNAAVAGRPGGSGGGGGGGDLAVGESVGRRVERRGNHRRRGVPLGDNRGQGGGRWRRCGRRRRRGQRRAGRRWRGRGDFVDFGTALTYAAGGRGFGTTSGTAPTGSGNPGSGGRGGHTGQNSGPGINGIVILRVALGGSGSSAVGIGRPRVAANGAAPLAGTALAVPSGWTGISPGFSILRNGLRSYLHTFDPVSEMAPSDVTYYCAPNGSDLNHGLHPGLPKRSIAALVAVLNAAPPAVGATIFLAPGTYGREMP